MDQKLQKGDAVIFVPCRDINKVGPILQKENEYSHPINRKDIGARLEARMRLSGKRGVLVTNVRLDPKSPPTAGNLVSALAFKCDWFIRLPSGKYIPVLNEEVVKEKQ